VVDVTPTGEMVFEKAPAEAAVPVAHFHAEARRAQRAERWNRGGWPILATRH